MKNGNLKLAIQKEGRLTEETLAFLRSAGLVFESYKQRLFSTVRNFPLEILYVRDDDIPDYVASGTVDIGILGQNVLNEERPVVKKLLNLQYGYCSLVVAVLKESPVTKIEDLKNKRIATSYPSSAAYFFKTRKIPIDIVQIHGSVEITPSLGVADAIVDLTSSGSTLAMNDLRILEKLYDSEAVFIANPQTMKAKGKQMLIDKLLLRLKGVLSAKQYKYVLMNAPDLMIPRLKKYIPGLKSPTISPLAKPGWVSVAAVIKEDVFWETIEKLKTLGATGILVLPIEKMIT